MKENKAISVHCMLMNFQYLRTDVELRAYEEAIKKRAACSSSPISSLSPKTRGKVRRFEIFKERGQLIPLEDSRAEVVKKSILPVSHFQVP